MKETNWEELRDKADTYYKELTKHAPHKGIGSHEYNYFIYGFEFLKNQFKEDSKKWLKGYEKGYAKCVEDQKLLESVKNDMADRQAGIEQELADFNKWLSQSIKNYESFTLTESGKSTLKHIKDIKTLFEKRFYKWLNSKQP